MKQGKIYNKITMAVLLLCVLLYLAYAIISAIGQPLTTTLAVEYEAGEGGSVTGYVVREESVLTSPYDITVLKRQEGEKVGTGQTVAVGYLTADAQERQAQIDSLTAQLEQLNYASSYQLDPADTAALDQDILEELSACARYTAQRDLNAVREQSAELKGLILRRSTDESDLEAIRSQISTLQTQLNQLTTISDSETKEISASAPGYFSGTVDGFESVLTPQRLSSLTVSELNNLTADSVPDNACGRLITSPTWYFVAAVPSEYVEETETGDEISVSFAQDLNTTITMTVSRIGDDENGQRLLVLRSSDYIQDVTLLRRQSANVVFRSYKGLRVPKEALRMDEEGQVGVYVLESAQATWKPVNILYDNGESYVVELDKTNTSNLWPGDEIIVDAKNLYDGKVVTNQ